ncbi:TetR family transcriptional regulator [Glaciihabitans sp. dw_435]|uniref:TetR family transcriptional regulator n=1 Tax=Glaciihabitans sp. dw_435 TaxID=2720081 RepID=UPI0035ABDB8F
MMLRDHQIDDSEFQSPCADKLSTVGLQPTRRGALSDAAYRYPKRSAHAIRTRVAILTAAAELFGENGYAGTTMKAIAAQAGVSVE